MQPPPPTWKQYKVMFHDFFKFPFLPYCSVTNLITLVFWWSYFCARIAANIVFWYPARLPYVTITFHLSSSFQLNGYKRHCLPNHSSSLWERLCFCSSLEAVKVRLSSSSHVSRGKIRLIGQYWLLRLPVYRLVCGHQDETDGCDLL